MSDTESPARGASDARALDDTLEAFLGICFDATPSREAMDLLAEHDPRREARLDVYRHMVRYRLVELAWNALPRTRALLGQAAFDAYVEAMLTARPPRTRFFREVVEDVVDPRDTIFDAEHARDLVRLELAEWHANHEDTPMPAAVPFEFEKRPVIHPGLVRLDVTSSVHQKDRPLEHGAFFLAVYRRPDHRVETRWFSARLAALLDAWIAGDLPAIEAVKSVLAARGEAPTPEFIDEMTSFLTMLLERGAVLGSAPP